MNIILIYIYLFFYKLIIDMEELIKFFRIQFLDSKFIDRTCFKLLNSL